MLILMVSPTKKPPASRATFQFSPKSLRLIDVCASKPATVVPKGDLPRPVSVVSSSHLAGSTANGQVAGYFQFILTGSLNARALEGDGRKLLNVQKVLRTQVRVALLDAGVQSRRVDLRLDGRAADVLLV